MGRFVDKGLRDVMARMPSILLCLVVVLASGCAQVPEQSVTLSMDVGKALEELRQKNAALIGQLFRDRRKTANDFVDTVYAPYAIERDLTAEKDYENTGQKISMLNLIPKLVNNDKREEALAMMNFVVEGLINDIKSKRSERLVLIEAQERQVKVAFDNAFGIVIQGNETTTGLLRSIRQVHSAQENVLQGMGFSQNLRGEVNSAFAQASDTIDIIIDNAQAADTALDKIASDSAECKNSEDEVLCKLNQMKAILETAVESAKGITK